MHGKRLADSRTNAIEDLTSTMQQVKLNSVGSTYEKTARAGTKKICMTCAAGNPCRRKGFAMGLAMGLSIADDLFHERPQLDENITLMPVTDAKLCLLKDRWQDAQGRGRLLRAWQIGNQDLEYRSAATQHNFALAGKSPDCIDAYHGTANCNVLKIAKQGWDRHKRQRQAYGEGDYFAKARDPNVSIGYTNGGDFLFLCKLLLGDEPADHRWVSRCGYYVVKQESENVQAMPVYILQFGTSVDAHEVGGCRHSRRSCEPRLSCNDFPKST
eukprot:4851599-Amphidinium_carterae.2